MVKRIDGKSLILGFLLGVCVILVAAQGRTTDDPPGRYRIATASSTWVIDTGTGDVWQIYSEQGSPKYTWLYAGKPPDKDTPRKDQSN